MKEDNKHQFMMTDPTPGLRRLKFTRCPYCQSIHRSHKLNEHMKSSHRHLSEQERNYQSTRQIKKEALLICPKDKDWRNFHRLL